MNPIKDPIEIVKLGLAELYSLAEIMFHTDEIDEKEYNETIDLVENGVKIKIPLLYIINNYYKPFPSSKRVLIKGYGRYNIMAFDKEVKYRENLLRQMILNNIDDESPTESRQRL